MPGNRKKSVVNVVSAMRRKENASILLRFAMAEMMIAMVTSMKMCVERGRVIRAILTSNVQQVMILFVYHQICIQEVIVHKTIILTMNIVKIIGILYALLEPILRNQFV